VSRYDWDEHDDPSLESDVRRWMALNYVSFAVLAIVAGAVLGLGLAPFPFVVFMVVAGLGLGWLLNSRRPWWGAGVAIAVARPMALRPYRRLSIVMVVVYALLFFATSQIVLQLISA
jgi:hypothetical protein